MKEDEEGSFINLFVVFPFFSLVYFACRLSQNWKNNSTSQRGYRRFIAISLSLPNVNIEIITIRKIWTISTRVAVYELELKTSSPIPGICKI